MRKAVKIIIVAYFIAIFCIGLFLRQEKEPELAVSAQESVDELLCATPIPIGEVVEETIDIMDEVFQIYQRQAHSLTLAIQNIQGVVASLTENPEVCDFSQCKPQVVNIGPTLGIAFDSFIFDPIGLYFRVPPICKPKECIGQPCPDLSPYVQGKIGAKGFVGLDTIQKLFVGASATIYKTFSDKPILISKEMRLPTDPIIDARLTQIESTLRKVEIAKNLTTPWSGIGKKTCVLNELEKAKLAMGEINPRKPELCKTAFEQGRYWPEAWSYYCDRKNECQYGPDEDCKECLKKDESRDEFSWHGKINYKLYKTCEDECKDKQSFDDVCFNCFCEEYIEKGEPEKCFDWICGGSSLNFVCCE